MSVPIIMGDETMTYLTVKGAVQSSANGGQFDGVLVRRMHREPLN